jgi:hypothetical protein
MSLIVSTAARPLQWAIGNSKKLVQPFHSVQAVQPLRFVQDVSDKRSFKVQGSMFKVRRWRIGGAFKALSFESTSSMG